MKNDITFECGTCHLEKSKRDIKRINHEIICNFCFKERRKNHREFLKRDILGIRKRKDLVKEWEAKRKLREAIAKEMPIIPKIKGEKIKKVSRQLHFYITKDERKFLFKKYILQGLDYDLIKEKIKRDIEYLSNLIRKLREKDKLEEEINKIFKEEFSKLIIREN